MEETTTERERFSERPREPSRGAGEGFCERTVPGICLGCGERDRAEGEVAGAQGVFDSHMTNVLFGCNN